MKKIFIPLMLAIVAIFIYSCKKEEIILTPITNSGSEVSFSAAIGEDQQTKTTFNDQTLKLFWKSNDKVYIWHKEASSLGTYKASADGAETNLVLDGGTSLQWVEGANTFSSVYVCNTSPTHSEDNFIISLPAIQNQSQANSTDHFGDYMAMKGYLSTTHTGVENVGNVDIHFSPLYSVLEFAFPYDADKKVTKVEAEIISEEGDQDLAFETANVSKNDNSTEITGLTTPSKKVTLNLTTQMDLSKGISKAWMIVKPGTYGSIKFTYTYASGEPDTKDYTNVTIERGTRYNITTYGNIVHNTANADDNTTNTIAAAITAKFGDEAITSLKVTGTMNQADFVTLKNMTTLATLDLSEVTVVGTIKIKEDGTTQNKNAIPYEAFDNNTTIKSILLPKNITTIGEYAFENCSGLIGNLTIPSTVTTIRNGAFSGCSNLTGNLTIPEGVETIGNNAFESCSGFNGTLTILEGVETIGSEAFYECTGFNGSLTIPSTVTTIGESAFYGCSGFNGNLTILEGVETIENNAFYECTGFNGSLTIPSTMTTIGEWAFYGCSGFNGNLTIPSTVTTIGLSAFDGCSSLTSLSLNYTGQTGSELPIYIEGMFPTQFVNPGATGIVTVPVGRESIYTSSEDGWQNLNIAKVVHNIANADVNTVNTIATAISDKFGAEALTTITSLKVIGTMNQADFETLNGMTTLVTLDLSEVTVVGDIKIGYNNSIEDYITQSGNAIPFQAFGKESVNTTLKSILLPKSITTIGDFAFENCTGLTGNLSIPEGVETIGKSAFFSCAGFNGTLIIPEGVETIGVSAFVYCTGFNGSLTIPSTVTTIGESAFYGCAGLNGTLTIPSTMTTIESDAFYGCHGLTGTLTIPSTVTTIGYYAFYGCSGFNGNLTIPSTVTTIGLSAFDGCSSLASLSLNYTGQTGSELPIYIEGMFPTQFVNPGATGIVVVPEGCESIYMSKEGWQDLNIAKGVHNTANDTDPADNNLEDAITAKFGDEAITSLKVTGTMNEADFTTLNNMRGLETLDLSEVTVVGDITIGYDDDWNPITQSGNAIPYEAFNNKISLIRILLPKSITTIGEYAFSGCSGLIGNLTILSTVTTIGIQAFSGCSNLTSLSLNYTGETGSELPTYNEGMFPTQFIGSGADKKPVTVPVGYKSIYMSKDSWKNLNITQVN